MMISLDLLFGGCRVLSMFAVLDGENWMYPKFKRFCTNCVDILEDNMNFLIRKKLKIVSYRDNFRLFYRQ